MKGNQCGWGKEGIGQREEMRSQFLKANHEDKGSDPRSRSEGQKSELRRAQEKMSECIIEWVTASSNQGIF